MARIEFRVEILKRQTLAGAALAKFRSRLSDFERNVQEAEDFTGYPFERGRALIQQGRTRVQRYERVLALLDQAAEAIDAGDDERAEALRLEATQTADDEVYQ